MPVCTKDFEIEMNNGRSLEVTVKVEGFFDTPSGYRPGDEGQWFIDAWHYTCEEELDEEEEIELEEKVEEKVFDESWDFEGADDSDLDSEG